MRLIDADEYADCVIDHMTDPWDRAEKHISNDYDKGLYDATLLLKYMPTVHPEPHWIPCNERLPEESGRYLVTRGLNACDSLWNRIYIANYSDLMGIKSEKIWWQGNVGKSDFERLDDVLAWMPLPDGYRGGEQNDDNGTDRIIEKA